MDWWRAPGCTAAGRATDGDHLGSVSFAAKTALYFRDNIQFPFFEKYLKGKGTEDLPKAYVFETGTNVWRKYSSWPPAECQDSRALLSGPGRTVVHGPGSQAGSV